MITWVRRYSRKSRIDSTNATKAGRMAGIREEDILVKIQTKKVAK